MIFEVYTDKAVIRRFNMLSQTEIAAENPWTLPLPFNRENAPFKPETRSENFAIPEFSSENGFNIVFDGEPFNHAYCKFPEILPFEAFHNLRIELFEEQNGEMVNAAIFDFCNDYRSDSNNSEREIPVGLLKGTRNYRLKMTPVNIYGKCGRSRIYDFKTPECGLSELPFDGFDGILKEDGNIYHDAEFASVYDMESIHIILNSNLQKYKNEQTFAVIELECEHNGNPAILMAHGIKPDYGRHYLMQGKTSVMRHSFELTHLEGERFSIFIGEGTPGKYKIHSLKYCKIKKEGAK